MIIFAVSGTVRPALAHLPPSEQIFTFLYESSGGAQGLYVKQSVHFFSNSQNETGPPGIQELYIKTPGKLYAHIATPGEERTVVQIGNTVRMEPNPGETWGLKWFPYLFLSQPPENAMTMFRSWGVITHRVCLDLVNGVPAYLIGAWNPEENLKIPALWISKEDGRPLRYQELDTQGRIVRVDFNEYDPERFKYGFPGVIEVFLDDQLQSRFQTMEILKMDLIPELYFDPNRIPSASSTKVVK